ncbi:VanZ family protein [Prevotella ihumii]|uniref:VanZ family protein n=1 Tax=Prevotella ihumii TaxID=1917878 RepID=UPI001F22CD8A|nr:VanZ family protein [Prevotella ihumii]
MKLLIKRFPLTILMTIGIWALCLIPVPETPLNNVALIDKWTHIGMFFVYGMTIAHEWFHTYKKAKPMALLLWVWLLPTLMGGVLELLQRYCTAGNRSAEWLDFVADALGCGIAWVIGTLLSKFLSKP